MSFQNNTLRSLSKVIIIAITLAFSHVVVASALLSDDFNTVTTELNPTWRFHDPYDVTSGNDAGESTITFDGTNAIIDVPDGLGHDLWKTSNSNKAPRLLQTAPNSDFQFEVKFETAPNVGNQLQGIIIQESNDVFLRFDIYHNVSGVQLFIAYINGTTGATTTYASTTLSSSPNYRQVIRFGDNWTFRYSDDGTTWTDVTFSKSLAVSEVGFFAGTGGVNPKFLSSVDYFIDLDEPITDNDTWTAPVPENVPAPVINTWNGYAQPTVEFGQPGISQKWANILGNVSTDIYLSTLTYTINGGSEKTLPFGPNNRRLEKKGDFNIEIDHANLIVGLNTIEIKAKDSNNQVTSKIVTISFSENVWPLPYIADWGLLNSIEEVESIAHIVDGLWGLTIDGIKTIETGYDRTIAIGDETWPSDNYEVTVPFTLHSDFSGIGFAIGWQGHEGNFSPRKEWPVQALAWIRPPMNNPTLNIITYGGLIDWEVTEATQQLTSLTINDTYMLKSYSESLGSGTSRFYVKFWKQDDGEPIAWNIQADVPTRDGSILLVVHKGDATFGNVSVEQASSPPDPLPPVINNVEVSKTNSTATITWDTDKNSNSVVDYGIAADNLDLNEIDSAQTQTHSITLTGLDPNTTYHYQVKSADSNNLTTTSDVFTFTTNSSTGSQSGMVSDDFNGVLDTSVWTFYDPVGDSTLSETGTQASISVPAGSNHDLWQNNLSAPRIRQAANNTDFEVEVKFDSALSTQFQGYGVTVEQDLTNLIRFDFFSNGSVTKIFSASFVNGIPTKHIETVIPNTVPLYLRVKREGNQWTTSYSYDGTSWIGAGVYTHNLNVTSVAIFGGNAGSTPPAYTALIDSFIVDGISPGSGNDIIPPIISNPQITATDNTATITWDTNEPSTSIVSYGADNTYGTEVNDTSLVTSHSLVLTGLSSSTLYHYQVKSSDSSNNVASGNDLTFTTDTTIVDNTPPVITSTQVVALTNSTATITWNTDELSTSKVDYGSDISYGSTVNDTALVTSHTRTLNGLTSNTTYHYQVSSTDNSNNIASDVDLSFTTQNSPPQTGGWWDNNWNYRASLTVNSGNYERFNKPTETAINFTNYLSPDDVSTSFDLNSVRVHEVDASGQIITQNIPFQFDPAVDYNALSKADGTLVFILNNSTSAQTERYFHVYFDVEGGAYTSPTFSSQVDVTDNVSDEGQDSFLISTDSANYNYQKIAGGFSSIVDNNGNDWLNYHPTGGSAGHYRGVPNLVSPTNGGHFHPGATTSISTLIHQGPLKATIKSITTDGLWEVQWEFFPQFARMSVILADKNFWFLYEGTPGGLLDANDFVVRPNGTETAYTQGWNGDLSTHEWVYLSDTQVGKSIFLAHHEDDNAIDSYRQKDNQMTVFGFGRDASQSLIDKQQPHHFTIGLTDTTDFGNTSATLLSAYKDITVTISSIDQNTNTPDTESPSTPGNLTAQPTAAQIDLNWTAATDNVGVTLYRVSMDGTETGTTATTSFQATGLNAGQSYSFSVIAEDASGNQSTAATVTATTLTSTDTIAPSIPTGLTLDSATANAVSISWTASTDDQGTVVSYRVFRDAVEVGTSTTTTYTDNTVQAEQNYLYSVLAIDDSGNESSQSTTLSVNTPVVVISDITPPTIPTGLTLNNATASSVSISWTASTDTQGTVSLYHILRDGSEIGTSAIASYTDNTVASETTYTYTVTAEDNSTNESTASDDLSVDTPTIPTTSGPQLIAGYPFEEGTGPTILDLSGNGNNGTLTGGATRNLGGETGEAIEFNGTDSSINLGAMNITTPTMSIALWFKPDDFGISDARLISKANGTSGSAHYWMISTISQSGQSRLRFRLKTENGGTSTLIGNAALIPGVWTHVTATYDGVNMKLFQNSIEVGSLAKTGAISTSPSIEAWIGANPSNNKFFDGLIDDVRLYGEALDGAVIQELVAGNLPLIDGGGNNTDTESPSTPGNLTAQPTAAQIDLNWTAATDNVGVTLYRVSMDGTETGTTATTSFQATGLNAGQSYSFSVIAEDASGNQSTAATVTATTLTSTDTIAPSIPTGLTLDSATANAVSISWTASTDDQGTVVSYRVFRDAVEVGTSTTTTYVDNTVQAEQSYLYSVLAIDNSGNESSQSTTLPVDTPVIVDPDIAPPTIPTGLTLNNATASSVSISWTASTDTQGTVSLYHILRDGSEIGTSAIASYTDNTVASETTYTYTVTAEDNSTNESTASDDLSVDTPTIPTTSGPQLIVGYPFEEGTGNTVLDHSGNGNNGTLTGGATRNLGGETGEAIEFNGTDSSINLGAMNITTPTMSIALWFKPDDFGISDARLISKANGTSGSAHYWMISTISQSGQSRLRFRLKTENGGTSTLIGNAALIPGVWTHVTATYDGVNMKLFQNSIEVGSLAKTGAISTSPSIEAWIGANPSNNKFFDGLIDDVRLYGEALDGAVIQELVAGNLPLIDGGGNNTDTESPSTPGNLTAQPTAAQIDLNWTAATDNVGVTLYRVSMDGTETGTTATTSFQATGLNAGQSYSFSVIAEDASGNQSTAATVTATTLTSTDTIAPSIPTGLTLDSATANAVSISWTASTDDQGTVVSYRVFRDAVEVGTSTTTTYVDNTVQAEQSYLYSVLAIDDSGNESSQSTTLPVDTPVIVDPDIAPPTIPTGLTLNNATASSVSISWTASTDTQGTVSLYHILRDGSEIGTSAIASYTDNTVASETTYTYTVTAEDNSTNESTASDDLSVDTPTIPTTSGPQLIVGYPFEEGTGNTVLDHSGNGNNGTLTGGATRNLGGETGEAIEFNGTDSSINLGAMNITTPTMSIALWFKPDDFGISDARLISKANGTSGSAHYWMISTISQSGQSRLRFRLKTENGGTSTLIGNAALIPGVWTHVTATYDGVNMKLFQNSIEVGSLAKTGAISTSPSIEAWIGANPSNNKFFDGLIDDVRLYGEALDGAVIQELVAGNLPLIDGGGNNTDTESPSTPGNLTAQPTAAQIDLNWTAATDNVGVTLYRVSMDGTETGTTATTSFQATGLNAGQSYSFSVIAEDASGNQSTAATVTATTLTSTDTIAPSIPTGLTLDSATANAVSISWTASTDDQGTVALYHILRDGSEIGTSTTTASYTDNTVTSETTYVYTVTAEDNSTNESAASDDLSVSTPAVSTTANCGMGIDLDGTDDWINIPDLTLANDFTIEGWFKLAPGIDYKDVLFGQEGSGPEIHFSTGKVRLYAYGIRVTANTPLLANTWGHVAITRSGTNLTIYINGVQDATGTWNGPLNLQTIGRGNQHFLKGMLDEIRIWNIARTGTEINTSFNTDVDSNTLGLIGYWNFNETDQTVADSSSLVNHGSLGLNVTIGVDDPVRTSSDAPFIESCN